MSTATQFTDRQLDTLARVLEVILPSDSGAGAREADAILYVRSRIDAAPLALRAEVAVALDDGEENPDGLVARLAADRSHPDWMLFLQLRTWAWEGFLCDPSYGGNRGRAGWRRFGVPGPAQPRGYHPTELALNSTVSEHGVSP